MIFLVPFSTFSLLLRKFEKLLHFHAHMGAINNYYFTRIHDRYSFCTTVCYIMHAFGNVLSDTWILVSDMLCVAAGNIKRPGFCILLVVRAFKHAPVLNFLHIALLIYHLWKHERRRTSVVPIYFSISSSYTPQHNWLPIVPFPIHACEY